VENKNAGSRKRNATSVFASSRYKRFRRSSSETREDSEVLNREISRRIQQPAVPNTASPSLQNIGIPKNDVVEQFRAELSDLRRQQAVDRAHFEFVLSAQNDQLEDLRRALDGRHQGRTPTQEPLREHESEVSTAKSEDDNVEPN
jgi:hypothetical protein